MTTSSEVLIVGAGPVGLWLATELRLHNIDVVILERNAEPVPHPKALGLHARTLEHFAMRGVVDTFLAEGARVPAWHFGVLERPIDLTGLESPYPFILSQPQNRTEALITERALSLGVRIERDVEVTGLRQDGDRVLVSTTAGDFQAQWTVGADGAGSTVRRAAGIDFPGTDATVYGFLGDVHADSAPAPGFRVHNERGALIVAPLPGGQIRVTGYDPRDQEPGRRTITLDELRETAQHISGRDFGLRDPIWLSRFGNTTRVAATYRNGRVFLAGDSAHMHFPAGGVGLNLGIQDAINLGWKLAATIQGRFAPDILDSYTSERRPWAEDVAEHTMAQTELITGTTPTGQALRSVLSDLLASSSDLSRTLASRLAGVDVHYPPSPDAHPLTGTYVSGLSLNEARPALLTDRITDLDLGLRVENLPPHLAGKATAILVRPDGYIWWATDDESPSAPVRHTLATLGVHR